MGVFHGKVDAYGARRVHVVGEAWRCGGFDTQTAASVYVVVEE